MDVIQDSPSEENDQPGSEAPGTEKKEDPTDSERRVVSRRPAKRTRSGSKKPKRTTRSRTAPAEEQGNKTEGDPQEDSGQPAEKPADVSEKRVISRRPAKRPRKSTTSTKRTTRAKAEDKQQTQSEKEADKAAAPPEAATTETASPEPAKAGEAVAEPVPETTKSAETPPPEPAADAPSETPSERTQEPQARGAQEHRRNRRRRQPRRQNEGGGSAENRERAERVPQSVVEILADNWTEEKARKYLSEGFLATLSTPLVSRTKVEQIDEEALRDRLKVVRRVLADECMVEDDASDLILLDMVMNALADRLEVYRLSSENASPGQLDEILQLRYNADRRLIETVTALKNA